MNKYLVTGAAGFIGAAIAKRLIEQGHAVWTIDNLSTGFQENLPSGVTWIQGGCQDQSSIDQLQGTAFDAILHIAGQSSGEISFDDPIYDLRTNTESTLRLINYGLEHGCPRFLYASTMSVYGAVADVPIAEDHPLAPLSFYGVGKVASEQYLRIYQAKGLQPTSLRYFNVYGPAQNMRNLRQGMVSIFLAQMIKQDKVLVKGALDRFRDFIYIDDVVDLTLQTLNDPQSVGGIYNVATGVKTTVGELLEQLKMVTGFHRDIIHAGSTPGDQKGIFADMRLVEETFGFKAKYDLGAGLKKMVDWAMATKW
ncbi:MAG: NAD-dependent epimerase/dehydratase family protein [Candidatus Omnitrophica bacterium]|nr:NAD-dependent epimerase/dehydratase family protein [Candidatus Omnitrophota bacterium]